MPVWLKVMSTENLSKVSPRDKSLADSKASLIAPAMKLDLISFLRRPCSSHRI